MDMLFEITGERVKKQAEVRSILAAWWLLLYFDWSMRFTGFAGVYEVVSRQIVRKSQPLVADDALSHAVDLACVFYPKRVLCLQRSAALAILLRRNGRASEMVIGAQLLPFLSHAWVEVGGFVINDKPYVTSMFQVLDRC